MYNCSIFALAVIYIDCPLPEVKRYVDSFLALKELILCKAQKVGTKARFSQCEKRRNTGNGRNPVIIAGRLVNQITNVE